MYYAIWELYSEININWINFIHRTPETEDQFTR